jgi:two-component system response regulator NreC
MSGVVGISGRPAIATGTWVAPPVTALAGEPASVERSGIAVLLVDDHPIVRAGVRYMLERERGFSVVGEASTGREAIRLALELRPDVVVMDVSLPDVGGLEATRAIKEHDPSIRVLIVSMHSDEEYVLGMLDAGADGYLLKQGPPEELRNGIVRVHAGERVLHQAALQALVARAIRPIVPPVESLSAREREILDHLADGATSKEIAVTLGLAPKTVENHRARILDKLGVANSAAAVRAAVARGLLPSRN